MAIYRDFVILRLSPEWDIFIHPPPPSRIGGIFRRGGRKIVEPEVVDDSTKIASSRHSRTVPHRSSQRLASCIRLV